MNKSRSSSSQKNSIVKKVNFNVILFSLKKLFGIFANFSSLLSHASIWINEGLLLFYGLDQSRHTDIKNYKRSISLEN